MTINNYNTPAQGTEDWHIPLNENFNWIADDITTLAGEYGVSDSVSASYNTPSQGSADWHIPLNENFNDIDSDVQTLADAGGFSDVGGYNTPSKGATDWHIPLNYNFSAIEDDLVKIESGLVNLTNTSMISVSNVYRSLIRQNGADGDLVVDVTSVTGNSLSDKFDNALTNNPRSILWVPSGTYTWDSTISFDTNNLRGPAFIFSDSADITVSVDWAFDIVASQAQPALLDNRQGFRLFGGNWTLNGTGLMQQTDVHRGFFSPRTVTGGTYGVKGDHINLWSEGWAFRGTTYDGVDQPIYMDVQSLDQFIMSDVTFKDFDTAVFPDGSSGQNITAVNVDFENVRTGSVGFRINKFTTGTLFNCTWNGDSGTMFTNVNPTIPSLVDCEVIGNGTLWSGDYTPEISNGVTWQQLQNKDSVSTNGPNITGPFIDASLYSGSLESRIQSAINDLGGDGTVIVSPGEHTWDSSLSIDVGGKDINILMSQNTWVNVSSGDWALKPSGDGKIGIYGGIWQGGSAEPGWVQSTATNLDIGVNFVFGYGSGTCIDVSPAIKGSFRLFDSHIQESTTTSLRVGGAGLSKCILSHCELGANGKVVVFDSAIDDFEGVRISAHPHQTGSVFAEANADVTGGWFNIKSEAHGADNIVGFDNNASTVADVIEAFIYNGWDNTDVAVWEGTKPRIFPDTDRQYWDVYQP